MKYILSLVFVFIFLLRGMGQGTLPETFFDGKSIVLVSNDPGARPAMEWKALADSVHSSLVEAGGDPVGYFELEQVAISDAVQADYSNAFSSRLVKNIIFVTRQKNNTSIHVAPYTGNAQMIPSTSLFGVSGPDLQTAAKQFAAVGANTRSKNLLVIDVPEFPNIGQNETSSAQQFIAENPLNLEVFKLGIPIEGSSAESGLLSYFRYDMYGKSQATILAEQEAQKSGIEQILKAEYPYATEWLTEAKTDQELIRDRVQFLLVKVEAREADMMKSMGLEVPAGESTNRTVVKYYIKLIVRNELYIGPEWDADPDWQVALRNFLRNLKK
ncbi:NTPase [Algoriphagus lutimaris]|uniref:NTPase n=1 Tax=Algoriphagus lutimaris TaxID=613197 RepID=UPI00196B707A|nr:NTPase [Algoriphagus lutimaris]MBN3521131.1 NTPase [Algoriphagus lutimaris]